MLKLIKTKLSVDEFDLFENSEPPMLFILDFTVADGGRLKRQEAEEEAEEVVTREAARSILKGIQPTFH